MVAGTFSDTTWVINIIQGGTTDTTTRVTANQYLALWGGAPFNGRIGGIQANARGTGSGAGNTVIDILLNGVSIWPIHTANRPTLASASTGGFACVQPEIVAFKQGDTIDIRVISVPAGGGHTGVSCVVALERPRGMIV